MEEDRLAKEKVARFMAWLVQKRPPTEEIMAKVKASLSPQDLKVFGEMGTGLVRDLEEQVGKLRHELKKEQNS